MEVRGLRPLPLPPPQLQGESRSGPSARLSQSWKAEKKKKKIRRRRAKDDGNTLVSTISHASPQSAWWFKYTSNGILVDYGNEAKVKQSCERIVIFRKVIESKGKKIDLNWNFI